VGCHAQRIEHRSAATERGKPTVLTKSELVALLENKGRVLDTINLWAGVDAPATVATR
jgi:hypothetical protein